MAHTCQGLGSSLLLLFKFLLILPSAYPLVETLVSDGVCGSRIFPGIINTKAAGCREVESAIVWVREIQKVGVRILDGSSSAFLISGSNRRIALCRALRSIVDKA